MEHQLTPEYIRAHIERFPLEDGGVKHLYQDREGYVESVSYELYPGVNLIFKEVHRPSYITNWRENIRPSFVMEYCVSGRLECQDGEQWLYHGTRDVLMFRKDISAQEQRYPLAAFCSVSLSVKPEEFTSFLKNSLGITELDAEEVFHQYLPRVRSFIVLKANDRMDTLFEQIRNPPAYGKVSYWKVKVFELLVLLRSGETAFEKPRTSHISRTQAVTAQKAHQYLNDHLFEKITIPELAKQLSTSPTQLKSGFRTVYGVPIHTYLRDQRIHAGAALLRDTDLAVRDIALRVGFCNMSKFADAFQTLYGVTPGEYRKRSEGALL